MATEPPRPADQLVHILIAGDTIKNLAAMPEQERIKQLKAWADSVTSSLPVPVLIRDATIYKWFMAILGIIVIACLGVIIFLAGNGLSVPDSITAIGAAALGGLVGLLAPSPVK